MPGLYEMLGGTVSVNQLRNVQIEDLLRREPVRTDTEAVRRLIVGRRVLVTGGGGSIGSELCRQILRFGPSDLMVLGHGENSIFDICAQLNQQLAMLRQMPGGASQIAPRVHPVIADIRFPDRVGPRLCFMRRLTSMCRSWRLIRPRRSVTMSWARATCSMPQ
jgi:FlaA1/EpsC-like NDP-sugar epimerase